MSGLNKVFFVIKFCFFYSWHNIILFRIIFNGAFQINSFPNEGFVKYKFAFLKKLI